MGQGGIEEVSGGAEPDLTGMLPLEGGSALLSALHALSHVYIIVLHTGTSLWCSSVLIASTQVHYKYHVGTCIFWASVCSQGAS